MNREIETAIHTLASHFADLAVPEIKSTDDAMEHLAAADQKFRDIAKALGYVRFYEFYGQPGSGWFHPATI